MPHNKMVKFSENTEDEIANRGESSGSSETGNEAKEALNGKTNPSSGGNESDTKKRKTKDKTTKDGRRQRKTRRHSLYQQGGKRSSRRRLTN